jgi:hypothetical protein
MRRRLWPFVVIVALFGALVVLTNRGVQAQSESATPTERARGLVFDGLREHDRGRCAGAFKLAILGVDPMCTHGPDPAPDGIDVTQDRTVWDLTNPTSAGSTSSGGVTCIGDGTTGPRVQAVYVVASGSTDRYGSIGPLIQAWAGQMDAAVNQSAAETGGERHIRFVTNPDCSLDVVHVTLSSSGDDNFTNTVSELRAQGFNRTDRKYLLWVDAAVYCGIAQVAGNDVPDPTNAANSGPTYARVDTGCWGRSDHLSELHELMHTLGAVQRSAPHATSGYHCTDEYDAMCYSDAAGVTMTYVCPSAHEWLLDCNHDDYFNTAPSKNSYLDTHWNVANSVFLTSSAGGTTSSPAPSPSPSPTSSPTPTASPTPATTATTTSTFSGSLSRKKSTRTFSLSVADGATVSDLEFSTSGGGGKGKGGSSSASTSPDLTLRILASDGTVVADGTGPSILEVAEQLSVGTYIWEVSGTSSVSFSLTVTYSV